MRAPYMTRDPGLVEKQGAVRAQQALLSGVGTGGDGTHPGGGSP